MNLVSLEYTAEWNIAMENILKKKELKLKKIKMKIFNFLSKITTDFSCKF